MDTKSGNSRKRLLVLGSVMLLACAACFLLPQLSIGNNDPRDLPHGSEESSPAGDTPESRTVVHRVITRQPETPTVATGKLSPDGTPETVSCRTCHDTQEPTPTRNNAGTLENFHQGLTYQHGQLACLSCHNSDNYDTLALANGEALPFRKTMQLCAQCHGPQHRDYTHGSHGGMTGHWDLTRGNRTRNHCIDCHDPHHPAYPQVMPVFPPQAAERH